MVAFISNQSWVSEASFVVLRRHLLESFDKFWIENLHGNRRISEYAPDGRTSETIFAMAGFSPGIQQGVATSLWVKSGKRPSHPRVLFREDLDAARAEERRSQLLASLEKKRFDDQYEVVKPARGNRFSFRPTEVTPTYQNWLALTDLCAVPPMNGLMEKRGGALIDIDPESLESRMRSYLDRRVKWEALAAQDTGLTRPAAGFDPRRTWEKVRAAESFNLRRMRRYAVRPFDTRWCYYSGVNPLWNRPRPDLWAQAWSGNSFFVCRPAAVADPEGPPMSFTRCLGDNDYLRGHAYYFPIRLDRRAVPEDAPEGHLFAAEPRAAYLAANLSSTARKYLSGRGAEAPDRNADEAAMLWCHALAIGFSPAYAREHRDGIRADWPRIPLPERQRDLERSVGLGREVADLLDTEEAAANVDSGAIRLELKAIGLASRIDGAPLDPVRGDLDLSGWGHRGKGGVTMPGKGRIEERAFSAPEREAIRRGGRALGLRGEEAVDLLGPTTYDVYLNGAGLWQNVPSAVWEYVLGGYPVLKKWLSYRDRELLGRGLTIEEVREVTSAVRRLAALVLLRPRLDDNYRAARDACWLPA